MKGIGNNTSYYALKSGKKIRILKCGPLTHTHTHTHTYTHIYTHIHTHIHTNTYIHTYIYIMLAYLYCAACTRMTMNESSSPCEQRRIIFNDDGQRVQLARPESPAPHYNCMYRLLPSSSCGHYYPRLIAGTNLPTPKGWIAWLAKADCTHITFGQGYYTIESKGTRRK